MDKTITVLIEVEPRTEENEIFRWLDAYGDCVWIRFEVSPPNGHSVEYLRMSVELKNGNIVHYNDSLGLFEHFQEQIEERAIEVVMEREDYLAEEQAEAREMFR